MNFREFVQAFRRRLLIVLAALVVSVAGGWVTAPGDSAHDTVFRATHTLIYELPQGQGGMQSSQAYRIEQIALLATSGNVPSRVADRLQLDRGDVRSGLSATAEPKVATIEISGRSSDPARAVSLANVSAEELMAELAERDQAAFQTELSRLTAEADAARKRLSTSKTPAEQSVNRGLAESADKAVAQFQATGQPKPKLRTLENGTATVVTPQGVKLPDSKPARAILFGVLGLLLGVATAFVLARLDSRIRSKRTADAAFGAPVVAEVPPLGKSPEGQLLTRTQPASQYVEAYRGLRTYLALWTPPKATCDDGHRVIVVTSPAPGEGKTTTVAHLAAMLAEIGRSVVVISADLRRPRLHQYFDRSNAPGLVDLLAATPEAPTFDDLDLSTPVRGVRLVPSGRPIENPAPLLEHCGDLLRAARGLAEFVIVDSPPLLVANDAVDLARHADGVLLVARAGKTKIEAAEQSAQLLKRLDIPVVGTVLIGSEAAPGASRYYSARYYGEPERLSQRRRRGPGGNGQHPTGDPMPASEESSQPSPEAAESVSSPAEVMTAANSAWVVNGHPETWTATEESPQVLSTKSAPNAHGS